MAIVGDAEGELARLWTLVCELSDQLNKNKEVAASLQRQADLLKGQAIHNGTGFALRRFNTDLSKEVFESELERMNAAIIIENQTLQHENKQLNTLLKEYETTLETVMAKFRSQAHAAQQHELNLTRHYETLILQLQSQTQSMVLNATTSQSQSVSKLSHLLRVLLRSFGGEDATFDPSKLPDPKALCDPNHPEHAKAVELLESLPSAEEHEKPDEDSEAADARADWALEREIEICRLEAENETLRRLLAISAGQPDPFPDPPMLRAGSPASTVMRPGSAASMVRPGSAASIDRPGSGMGMGTVRAVGSDAWGDVNTPRYTRGQYDHMRPSRAPRGYIVGATPSEGSPGGPGMGGFGGGQGGPGGPFNAQGGLGGGQQGMGMGMGQGGQGPERMMSELLSIFVFAATSDKLSFSDPPPRRDLVTNW
ncbi:hypothetical protein RhiJN_14791 [Ceratobasidium sp. AG-Ba]|nr:hypothetical protein RhiJN_14791 [Ceratobasidium sp. AG-Ba]QRW15328.1 hypothetical protein RhiLY_14327 [Ceratobasidium sp. AG-Ba]